jgi:putative flippase GtrA
MHPVAWIMVLQCAALVASRLGARSDTPGAVHRFSPMLKYLVVGSAAFVIDFSLTAIAAEFMPLLLANTLGFLVANFANFAAAHRWVFGGRHGFRNLWQAYVAVLAISLVGLAINDAVVWTGVELLDFHLLSAKVAATIAGLVWNYLARTKFVYQNHA